MSHCLCLSSESIIETLVVKPLFSHQFFLKEHKAKTILVSQNNLELVHVVATLFFVLIDFNGISFLRSYQKHLFDFNACE